MELESNWMVRVGDHAQRARTALSQIDCNLEFYRGARQRRKDPGVTWREAVIKAKWGKADRKDAVNAGSNP
jgi:hypothetical protein